MCSATTNLDSSSCLGPTGSSDKDWTSLGVVFFGIFLCGFGSSAILCFGLSFADDNVDKDKSPLALSFAWMARLLGPALGFVVGSASLDQVGFDQTFVNDI